MTSEIHCVGKKPKRFCIVGCGVVFGFEESDLFYTFSQRSTQSFEP